MRAPSPASRQWLSREQSIKVPGTERVRRLARGQPENALAVPDKDMAAVVQAYFAELLADADAELPAALGEGASAERRG